MPNAKTVPPTALLATLALAAALALPAPREAEAARIKCWTNKEGVRECGNVVPPEYAQQETEVKSKQGLTVKKTARAKTKEELEAERAERERLAAIKAEEERRAREQARRDRVLLQTYTTEDDFVLARDGQLAAIDSRIRHTQQIRAKLEEQLQALEAQAAKRERSGKKVDPATVAEIDRLKRQIADNDAFIAKREREKAEIVARFEADLARWRELKGRRGASTGSAN